MFDNKPGYEWNARWAIDENESDLIMEYMCRTETLLNIRTTRG